MKSENRDGATERTKRFVKGVFWMPKEYSGVGHEFVPLFFLSLVSPGDILLVLGRHETLNIRLASLIVI